MGILDALLVIHVALEHHLPFRGLVSDQIGESIKEIGFRHYMIAWLPTWWFILACSMLSAGVGVGCAVWAVIGQMADQPIGVPILIGATSLVSAFAGLVVPITLAWFKDRSESRHTRDLEERSHLLETRIKELELQVESNKQGHVENALNIKKIAAAAEKIVEVKQQLRNIAETKKDQPEQDT